jgi:hypothetical protein
MSIGPPFSYVRSRSDHAIMVEQAILLKAYDAAGRDGLITTIEQLSSDERFERNLYFLADPSFAPVAGNLKIWPSALEGSKGWSNLNAREWKPEAADRPLLRAAFETLPDGYHLLVGKYFADLDGFVEKIRAALASTFLLTFLLSGRSH